MLTIDTDIAAHGNQNSTFRESRRDFNGGRTIVLDHIPSTNRWIIENPTLCSHGDIVRAIHQTAGHGRFGRSWFSSAGSLTVSVAIDPTSPLAPPPFAICAAAAVAVAGTLDALGIQPQLKWPNDVLINSRKTCGILAETGSQPNTLIALGIGLNVNVTDAELENADLGNTATSLRHATGRNHDLAAVMEILAREINTSLALSVDTLRAYWKSHDALTERSILVMSPTAEYHGIYDGLDPDFAMRLRMQAGHVERFTSGDVTILSSML